jgi:integrase
LKTRTGLLSKLKDFKRARLVELSADTIKVQKGIRVQELFADYIATLEERENTRGHYMTASRFARPSYKTQSAINKHLLPVVGNLKPEEITTPLLNKYVKDRMAAHASRISVNRELAYLRRSLRLGSEATPRKVNPVLIPKFPIDAKAEKLAARTGTIDAETYDKLYIASAPHFRPILTTVLFTGVRSKEIKFIRPEQVDFKNGVIHLRTGETKEGDSRTVPMCDLVQAELSKWSETTKQEWPGAKWFFHFEGEQILDFKKAWQRAVKRAGVVGVRFHDSRRTVVTTLMDAGVQMADIRKVTGHKSDVIFDYDQSTKGSIDRVRAAQNVGLGVAGGTGTVVELEKVVGMFKDGLLSKAQFEKMKLKLI